MIYLVISFMCKILPARKCRKPTLFSALSFYFDVCGPTQSNIARDFLIYVQNLTPFNVSFVLASFTYTTPPTTKHFVCHFPLSRLIPHLRTQTHPIQYLIYVHKPIPFNTSFTYTNPPKILEHASSAWLIVDCLDRNVPFFRSGE